jgi:hypothetical protein
LLRCASASTDFRQQERSPEHITLVRRENYDRPRSGNVAQVKMTRLAPARISSRTSAATST